AIREKVGRQFAKDGGDTAGPQKRRKIQMGTAHAAGEGSEMDTDSDEDDDK
ncbi:hypothetical protein H4R21_003606, partial [Coemansia helicoidea]